MTMPIIVIGGGGHATVVVDTLRAAGLAVSGVIDPRPEAAGHLPAGVQVIGRNLDAIRPDRVQVVLGVGSIDVAEKNPRPRIYAEAKAAGFTFVVLRHPSAVVSACASLGDGAQIMAGAILQPGVFLGVNCIVNTGASLDHDCRIGDHVHIAPGAVLSGGVIVGDGSHIGTGAIVIQNVRIGAGSMIAAGAVVTRDVLPGARVRPGPQG
jgi:sugar O-acyltransferase (sialic acid O-acetyltransferase NeuD family)